MKKIVLILALLFLVVPAFAQECKYQRTIYCNEFDYICCCLQQTDENNWNQIELKNRNPDTGIAPIQCPTGIDVKHCSIQLTIVDAGLGDGMVDVFTGSGDCSSTDSSFWNGERWRCTTETKREEPVGSNPLYVLYPGQYIYIWSNEVARISSGYTQKYVLRRTGRAADCTAGIIVAGTVGCTFNPDSVDGTVYEFDKASKIAGEQTLGETNCLRVTSPGDRRECGNTCESCSSDSDCAALYDKQINYNGRNLGGYCSNGELVLYGCEPTGGTVCTVFDDMDKDGTQDQGEECTETQEKNRCDIVKRITTGIECCSSDDCRGVGDYYCDWTSDTTSSCVLKAQCERDTDCGTATKCDRNKKTITEPYCNEQKQCDEKTIKTNIECCTSSDCASNQYCTSDYVCKLTPAGATTTTSKEGAGGPKGPGGMVPASPLDLTTALIIIIVIVAGGAGAYWYMRRSKTSAGAPKEVCGSCGAELKPGTKFCTTCGKKLK